MIAAVAALVVLTATMFLAVELLFEWSEGGPVRGQHVIGVMLIVLLLTWRIATRVIDGTM